MSSNITVDDVIHLIDSRSWDDIRTILLNSDCKHLFKSSAFGADGFNLFQRAAAAWDVPTSILELIYEIDDTNVSEKSSNRKKCTPLHLACESGSSGTVRKILTMLENSYETDLDEDSEERTPLGIVWLKYVMPGYEPYIEGRRYVGPVDSEDVENILEDLVEYASMTESERLKHGCGDVKDIWAKTIHLILFSSMKGKTENPAAIGLTWNIVHVLSDGNSKNEWIDSFCPSLLLWYAIKLFPEQTEWRNFLGQYPLHIACAGRPLQTIFEDVAVLGLNDKASEFLQQSQKSAIEMLLAAYPDAVIRRDKVGRFPIHHAAETGKSWHDAIRLLVKAAPRSLDARDPITGLHPFMLAAVGSKNGKQNARVEHCCLDSIFELLRANPSHVRSAIRPTAYESYLEGKLEVAKKSGDELQRVLDAVKARNAKLEQDSAKEPAEEESGASKKKQRIA